MTGTDVPRSVADRIFGVLLLAYPREFRDRFGAGMRYAFSRDRETARSAGVAVHARFWLENIVDTTRTGLAERSGSRSKIPQEKTSMKSWFTVDWRDGWRSLRATPAVTALAVLSLGLGIGANSALFSIYNGLMLKSLPVAEADRLVLVDGDSWSNPIWEEIRARQDQIADGAFAWSAERFNLSASGETDPVDGIYASATTPLTLSSRPLAQTSVGSSDSSRTASGPSRKTSQRSKRLPIPTAEGSTRTRSDCSRCQAGKCSPTPVATPSTPSRPMDRLPTWHLSRTVPSARPHSRRFQPAWH